MVDRSAKQSVKAEGFSRTRVSRRSKSDSLANRIRRGLLTSTAPISVLG
jgi:hypothetical protein